MSQAPSGGRAFASRAQMRAEGWRKPLEAWATDAQVSGGLWRLLQAIIATQVKAIYRGEFRGEMWLGYWELAKVARVHPRTAKHYLRLLREAGVLELTSYGGGEATDPVTGAGLGRGRGTRTKRPADGSPGLANGYRLGPVAVLYKGGRLATHPDPNKGGYSAPHLHAGRPGKKGGYLAIPSSSWQSHSAVIEAGVSEGEGIPQVEKRTSPAARDALSAPAGAPPAPQLAPAKSVDVPTPPVDVSTVSPFQQQERVSGPIRRQRPNSGAGTRGA